MMLQAFCRELLTNGGETSVHSDGAIALSINSLTLKGMAGGSFRFLTLESSSEFLQNAVERVAEGNQKNEGLVRYAARLELRRLAAVKAGNTGLAESLQREITAALVAPCPCESDGLGADASPYLVELDGGSAAG